MEEYVRKNGYVEVWKDGEFVGNYDTIEEYHKEKEQEEEDKQSFSFCLYIIQATPTPPYIIIIS